MTEKKIVQYLNEARATEAGLVRVLQSQIALTPRGDYRSALERHLRETRQHGARLECRLDELGVSKARVQATIGAAETALAQGLAIGRLPLDLLRGHGGAEKVLKNAKDAAATEALEIATYMAIERLASALGDDATARLAASIRADEERMLATILDLVPTLTDAVLGGRYEVASTGAGETELVKVEAYERRHDNRSTVTERIAALRAREPWPGYDDQNADQVASVLRSAGEDDARRRAAREYERAHKNRTTVLEAV
jgi:ferritin-like metal-binding protein YciE